MIDKIKEIREIIELGIKNPQMAATYLHHVGEEFKVIEDAITSGAKDIAKVATETGKKVVAAAKDVKAAVDKATTELSEKVAESKKDEAKAE